jgi:hypothetical protein
LVESSTYASSLLIFLPFTDRFHGFTGGLHASPPLRRSLSKSVAPTIESNKSSHTAVASPAPTVAPSVPLSIDLARLRSINIPETTIEALQNVWEPTDVISTPSEASRKLNVEVDFGFLPKREAKSALDAQVDNPLFPDDKVRQQTYECFLKASAGESKDWYTVRYFPFFSSSTGADPPQPTCRSSSPNSPSSTTPPPSSPK